MTDATRPARPVHFVLNGQSGRPSADAIVAEALAAFPDRRCFFHAPRSIAELQSCLESIDPAQCSGVVLFGGDGTLNRALPAVLKCALPVYVFPMGTANDLATHLGQEARFDALRRALLRNKPKRVDVIEANGAPFLTVGGVGVGAHLTQVFNAARDASPFLKRSARLAGSQIYTVLAAHTMLTRKDFIHRLRIEANGETFEVSASNVLVCNQPAFGRDLTVAPLARHDDGVFDVLILQATTRAGLLASLAALKMNREAPGALRLRTSRMVLTDVEGRAMAMFGDGEPLLQGDRISFSIGQRSCLLLRA